jgi:hypothetical protein
MLGDAETHEMELRGVDAAGREEWFCPTCGRHFLMSWPPDYGRTIIEPGDEEVTHTGAKGGLRMGAPTVSSAVEPALNYSAPLAADEPLSDNVEALWRKVLSTIEQEGDA